MGIRAINHVRGIAVKTFLEGNEDDASVIRDIVIPELRKKEAERKGKINRIRERNVKADQAGPSAPSAPSAIDGLEEMPMDPKIQAEVIRILKERAFYK